MLERLTLTEPPQTERVVAPPDDAEQRGFWTHIQAAFRGLSGAYADFASDPDPQVRALGMLALRRQHPQADDYFAIGDRCAQLTLHDGRLSSAYAVKTIAAYDRARGLAPQQEDAACAALLDFVVWLGEAAANIGSYDALKVGLLMIERVQQMDLFAPDSQDMLRLQESRALLDEQVQSVLDEERIAGVSEHLTLERDARALRDRGHLLLRQDQPEEALVSLERSLQIDDERGSTWLLCAVALTDLGRYDDAITAYDRALLSDRSAVAAWTGKGTLLLELGRLEQALGCFDKALYSVDTDEPTQALLLLHQGKAFYMLKRYAEARDALEQSHALQPSPDSAAGIAACRELLDEN